VHSFNEAEKSATKAWIVLDQENGVGLKWLPNLKLMKLNFTGRL